MKIAGIRGTLLMYITAGLLGALAIKHSQLWIYARCVRGDAEWFVMLGWVMIVYGVGAMWDFARWWEAAEAAAKEKP